MSERLCRAQVQLNQGPELDCLAPEPLHLELAPMLGALNQVRERSLREQVLLLPGWGSPHREQGCQRCRPLQA